MRKLVAEVIDATSSEVALSGYGTATVGARVGSTVNSKITRMWTNAQLDGRPAEYRWRPLFNAAKFG